MDFLVNILLVIVSCSSVLGQRSTEIYYQQILNGELLDDNDIIKVVETPYTDPVCDQFPVDQVGVSFTRAETVTGWKRMVLTLADEDREQGILWGIESEFNINPNDVYFKHEKLFANRICFWFEDRGIGDQKKCKYMLVDGYESLNPQVKYDFTWDSE